MKKLLLFIITICLTKVVLSQNVGIGTAVPSAKLHINHKATASSPTLRLFDSTAGTGSSILFAKESQTNTFSIISTNSTFAADNTLDFRTTFNSGFLLRGNGRVGINNVTNPAATLHVGGGVKINDTLNIAGDVNLGGNLKVANISGTAGQVLGINQSGNPDWVDINLKERFASFYYIDNTSVQSWTVPAGVTKIIVEAWGGGGDGASSGFGGGGGGGYVRAFFDNLSAGQVLSIFVGGGGQVSLDAGSPDGDTTTVSMGAAKIYAMGGKSGDIGCSLCSNHGGFGGVGTGTTQNSNFGWYMISGDHGKNGSVRFDQYGATSFAEVHISGSGGNAGNTVNTGGSGGYQLIDRGTGSGITLQSPENNSAVGAKIPGGGGPTHASSLGRKGANGMAIIHY